MSQHDYDLSDGLGVEFRADLNALLLAISSSNAGPAQPGTRTPGMLWLDNAANPPSLKLRNVTDSDWWKVAINGANYLPLEGGVITGNLAVAGKFTNADVENAKRAYAGTTAPASPVTGQMWFNTTTTAGVLNIYSGSAWVTVVDLTSPVFTNQVTINNAATGNAQLNLTSAGERRRIVGEAAGNRIAFYGPADQATLYISDGGDVFLPKGGYWLKAKIDTLQANLGFTPVAQYDGSVIQIGGNPAHLYMNGADLGPLMLSPVPIFNRGDTGSFSMGSTAATYAGNSIVAGTAVRFYPGSAAIGYGSWRHMDRTHTAGDPSVFHRVA